MTLQSLKKTMKNTLSLGFKIFEPSQQIKMFYILEKNKTVLVRTYNKHHIVFYEFQLRSYHSYL